MARKKKQGLDVERSAATQSLVNLLSNTSPDETITFGEMQRVTNLDIRGNSRYLLDSARRILQNQYNMVFGSIRGVGVSRLRSDQLVEVGRRNVKKISRTARRGGKAMDTANRAELSKEQRFAHDATRGVLASLERIDRDLSRQVPVSNRDPVVVVP
jgi:hypothetical protein